MTQQHLKFILKGGHVFLGRTIIRDYEGFNGPGSLWLMQSYDGFNGLGTFQLNCIGVFWVRWTLLKNYYGFNGPGKVTLHSWSPAHGPIACVPVLVIEIESPGWKHPKLFWVENYNVFQPKSTVVEVKVDKYIKSGMVINIGYGHAFGMAILYLGQQLRVGALEVIIGIASSIASASEAAMVGIPLNTYIESSQIGFAFDDADIIEEETLVDVIGRGSKVENSTILEKNILLLTATKHLVFMVEGKIRYDEATDLGRLLWCFSGQQANSSVDKVKAIVLYEVVLSLGSSFIFLCILEDYGWSFMRDYDGFDGTGHLEDKVFLRGRQFHGINILLGALEIKIII